MNKEKHLFIGFPCQFRRFVIPFEERVIHIREKKNLCNEIFVVQICISVIQIRTSVKKFRVYIIQIKIHAESIQIRHRDGQRLFEHSNSLVDTQIRNKFIQFSMHFTYVYLYSSVKTKCLK